MNITNNSSLDYITALNNESKAYAHFMNVEWEYKNGLAQYADYQLAKAFHARTKSDFERSLINELLA